MILTHTKCFFESLLLQTLSILLHFVHFEIEYIIISVVYMALKKNICSNFQTARKNPFFLLLTTEVTDVRCLRSGDFLKNCFSENTLKFCDLFQLFYGTAVFNFNINNILKNNIFHTAQSRSTYWILSDLQIKLRVLSKLNSIFRSNYHLETELVLLSRDQLFDLRFWIIILKSNWYFEIQYPICRWNIPSKDSINSFCTSNIQSRNSNSICRSNSICLMFLF